jgi:hypothetical protein
MAVGMNLELIRNPGNVFVIQIDECPQYPRYPGMDWTGKGTDRRDPMPRIPAYAGVHLVGRASEDCFRALSRHLIHQNAGWVTWDKDLWTFTVFTRHPSVPLCTDEQLIEVISDRVRCFTPTEYTDGGNGENILVQWGDQSVVSWGGRSTHQSQIIVDALNAWYRLMGEVYKGYPHKVASLHSPALV